jgi:hypothetical protein
MLGDGQMKANVGGNSSMRSNLGKWFVAALLLVPAVALEAPRDKSCNIRATQFPATGQTECWDTAGNLIPCAGTGQDGEFQTGAPLSYTDNGNGTITDNNTGLMWEKKSNDGTFNSFTILYTWDQAFTVHVAGLNAGTFGGHSDWRLPNVRELESIVDYATAAPAVSVEFNSPHCTDGSGIPVTVLTGNCTLRGGFYWSSTNFPQGGTNAMVLAIEAGQVVSLDKANTAGVRAVRCGL